MSDLVHLAVKHATTKKVGTWATALEQVSTACQPRWSTRPRRSLLPSLVDCPACRAFIAANKLPENWAFPEVKLA